MFTLPSIGKILVIVAVILLVWYGFKLVGHLDRKRKEAARVQNKSAGRTRRGAQQGPVVHDLVKCPACGSYVTGPIAGTCGRPGCPGRA